jgi:hypothetical protein
MTLTGRTLLPPTVRGVQAGDLADRQCDLRSGLPLGWYWCRHSMAAVHHVFGPGLRGAGVVCRPWRARQVGDLFVTAVQVMNTAIAANWHVAAAQTKA